MFPFLVPLYFLKDFREEQGRFEEQEVDSELAKIEINFISPWEWEISVPALLSPKALHRLFYSLYHYLNYLFDYLDYRIKVQESRLSFDKHKIEAYFSFIKSTPFL